MNIGKAFVILLCVFAVMASLWQINIAVDCLLNGWSYAFPFRIKVIPLKDVWLALDFYYFLIGLAALVLSLLACTNEAPEYEVVSGSNDKDLA